MTSPDEQERPAEDHFSLPEPEPAAAREDRFDLPSEATGRPESPKERAGQAEPVRGREDEDIPHRLFAGLYAVPLLLLLAWVALPLARGTETLYLRDVLNTHFPMKQAQAEAMREGYFPLLDPYRAGGQPLAGNLNAVPFYPTNLLYFMGSAFWALNAHFWIHLLLAPLAFFWMARSWGLARAPAWAGSVCYTVSGFFLSHMSFYNLIAAAALAPALVAACIDFAHGRRRALTPVAIALLWALLLLGGDPLMAALAGLLAGTALLLAWGIELRRHGRRPGWAAVGLAAAAFVAGTLLALPQIVEFLRILPLSFRGYWGYTQLVATVASFDPRQIVEWLIPFAFGRPDLMGPGAFWGSRFYTDTPPYFLSLYPGLLVFALLAAAGRPRRTAVPWAARWAWGSAFCGLFVSLGRFNPLVAWVFGKQGSLRYPVKFWLPVAVGTSLLCGLGFDRLVRSEATADLWARRRFAGTLALLALVLGAAWAFLSFAPGPAHDLLRRHIPNDFKDLFVANERVRWAGLCVLSLLLVAVLAVLARITRRRPVGGGALLLAVHALAQITILRPLYPTDALKPYLVPPPALAYVPADVRVVNPDFNYLFGPSSLKQGDFPSPRSEWMERRAFYELYPFTGPLWKRRYELNVSAEGLDSFLTRMAQGSIKGSDNEKRLRLLAAWGVGRLLINHPLQPQPERAKLLATLPSFGRILYIYEVADRAPEAFLARRVFPAPHLNAAYTQLSDPGFDPRTDAVLPGKGTVVERGGGTAHIEKEGPESVEVDVEAGPGGSVLVVQRAYMLYSAKLDGRPVPVLTANLHRLGVEVPAGRHHVSFWIDRTAFVRSFYAVALGLAFLPILAAWGGRQRAAAPAALADAEPTSPVRDLSGAEPDTPETPD
jgi:hypothetical protein